MKKMLSKQTNLSLTRSEEMLHSTGKDHQPGLWESHQGTEVTPLHYTHNKRIGLLLPNLVSCGTRLEPVCDCHGRHQFRSLS